MNSKKQTLVFTGDLNSHFLADPGVLRNSVLGNLLSNAIKFSPIGSTVEVAIERANGVRLAIKDRGPGIPEDIAKQIAEGQEPKSQTGTAGETGRGLGLMISRDFLGRMGGQLELRSRDDGGTEKLGIPEGGIIPPADLSSAPWAQILLLNANLFPETP